jgi:hypothetical protein
MLTMLLDSTGSLCILHTLPGLIFHLDAENGSEGTRSFGVDLVGEDAQGEGLVQSLVEASRQPG